MNNITSKITNSIKNLKSSQYSDINTVKFIASGGCWPNLTVDKYYITYDIDENNYIIYYNNLLINVVKDHIMVNTSDYIVADNKIIQYKNKTKTLKIINIDQIIELYDNLKIYIHNNNFTTDLYFTDGFDVIKYDAVIHDDNNSNISNMLYYNNLIYNYNIKYIAAIKTIKVTLD